MMVRYCSGIICRAQRRTPAQTPRTRSMVGQNRESHRTDFTVSVDAAEGITTGISAQDRTQTIASGDPRARPEQLVQPGHVSRSAPVGGVLERAGQQRRLSTCHARRTASRGRALRAGE